MVDKHHQTGQYVPVTLVDAKNAILSHFLRNDTFSLAEDAPNVVLDKETEIVCGKYKDGLIRAALADFVKSDLVVVLDETAGVWMLRQPIDSYPQSLSVSPHTAQRISDAINAFAKGAEIKEMYCNRLNITEYDINNLIDVFNMVLDSDDGVQFEGDN